MKLDTFFEKFDQFADAPGGVAKMRELICQFAIQGKLVPQDPNDEPAARLISQIAAENLSHVAASTSRQREKDVPICEEDLPFKLPDSWLWTRLATIARRIHYGYTASARPEIQDVRLLRITDIQKNRVDWQSIPGCEIAKADVRQYQLERGDILVARTGGTVGKTYLVQDIPEVAVFASYLIRIQGGTSLFDRYLKLFMESPTYWAQLEDGTRGAAQPNVNGQTLGKMIIPLPPLAEQKRIVAKVDQLMALCDRLEAQQKERETRHSTLARASLARFADEPTPANLQFLFHKSYDIKPADLRKSILTLSVQGKLVPQDPNDEPASELLSRLARELTPEQRRSQAAALPQVPTESLQYEVPDSWTWARFRDIAIIASNLVKPDQFLDFTHLAPDNIEKGNGVLLPCRTVREDKVISSNHRFYPGQIVYSKIRPNLAKVVVVDFEGLCSADMYPIDALINAFYLQLYMLSEAFLVQAVKTDTRVAMPKINQTELKAIAVPLPPLAEQRRIVAKVEQLMALVDELEAQLAVSRDAGEALLAGIVGELADGKMLTI